MYIVSSNSSLTVSNKFLPCLENTNLLCKGKNHCKASCMTGLDLTKQVNLLLIQHKQSSLMQTNKKEVNSAMIVPLTKLANRRLLGYFPINDCSSLDVLI